MSSKYKVITDSNIGQLVRKAENDWTNGTTTSSKYVKFSISEKINTIDAYVNSKHISGLTDSLGREKPFFNIVTAARNIWFRATDIDRKDIKIRPTKSKDTTDAFLATVHIQDWMRRENFGAFLNEWGRVLATYGSAVLKFVEKGTKLIPSVVAWQRLMIDSVDFDNNPKIEILELTEAQLRAQEGYDQDMVDKLCDALTARKTTDGVLKDTKPGYVRLYEVHGNLPLSYLTGKDKDKDIYTQQMHVITFVASKEKGDFDDYTLISGKEDDPYMITHLIREDGQSLAMGAVESLFEAQWMVNHTAKAIKDQLDLASKLIFQTADGTFVGQNALSSIENGDILIHAASMPLTQLQNNSHDIASLQNYNAMWKSLGNEIVGISDSMLGNTAPSGTAWRQVETLLQENHSLFDLMTENKGLDIEQMFRKFVIPHIKRTRMNTSDEVSATLNDYDIHKIDQQFIKGYTTKEFHKRLVETILNGGAIDQGQQQQFMQQSGDAIKQSLLEQGNQRFFVPDEIKTTKWKEIFKDLEWEVEVDVTGENTDKDAMTTLNTMLQYFAKKQGQPLSPEEKLLFTKILNLTGAASPLEITSLSSEPPQPSPMTPQPTAVPTPAAGS